jgi:VIT1/CCC1 family predicted Fe2+/Mn2+ transporter
MSSMPSHDKADRPKTKGDVARYLENRQNEVDSAAQYHAMANSESRPAVADVYRKLAAIEEKHATFWEKRLAEAGITPGPRQPSARARVLMWLARRFGPQFVLPTIAAQEYNDRNSYLAHPETRGTNMTEEERMHARVLESLVAKGKGVEGPALGRLEGRHRTVGGNTLRAAVLGANDGLCSNLSLIMGVAGATVDHRTILLTAIAGLLAGASSMALGEWVSVTSSRELAEREMRIERSELEEAPEEEREELELIYESKGLAPREAKELSAKLMKDPKKALDALSREELGIDPNDLGGSAWVAAGTSLLLFAAGAVIPVIPYFFIAGNRAAMASVGAGGIGLFGIGAAISLFTGRSVWFSGARQLFLGFAAAAITFSIGKAIGVAVAG